MKENILMLIIGFFGGMSVGVPLFIWLMKRGVALIAKETANRVADSITKAANANLLIVSKQTQSELSKATSNILEAATNALFILKDFVLPESSIQTKQATTREIARAAVAKIKTEQPRLVGDYLIKTYHVHEKPFESYFSELAMPLATIQTESGIYEIRIAAFDNNNTTTINGERAVWNKCFVLESKTSKGLILAAYFPHTVEIRRFEESPDEFLLDLHGLFCGEILHEQGSLTYLLIGEKRTITPLVGVNYESLSGNVSDASDSRKILETKAVFQFFDMMQEFSDTAFGDFGKTKSLGRVKFLDKEFEIFEGFLCKGVLLDAIGAPFHPQKFNPLQRPVYIVRNTNTTLVRFVLVPVGIEHVIVEDIRNALYNAFGGSEDIKILSFTPDNDGKLDDFCDLYVSSIYHFDAGDSPSAVEFKDWKILGQLRYDSETLVICSARYCGGTIDEQANRLVAVVRDANNFLIETVIVFSDSCNDELLKFTGELLDLEKGKTGQIVLLDDRQENTFGTPQTAIAALNENELQPNPKAGDFIKEREQ